MIIVPIGYGAQELFDISQVRGGTPYGATTIAAWRRLAAAERGRVSHRPLSG